MAHAAASIKKARVEMEQAPDLKALEKAREKRRRSRERAERRRKVMQTAGAAGYPNTSSCILSCIYHHHPSFYIHILCVIYSHHF